MVGDADISYHFYVLLPSSRIQLLASPAIFEIIVNNIPKRIIRPDFVV